MARLDQKLYSLPSTASYPSCLSLCASLSSCVISTLAFFLPFQVHFGFDEASLKDEEPSPPRSLSGVKDDLVPALDSLEGGAGIDRLEGGKTEMVGSNERVGDIRWADACEDVYTERAWS